MTATKHYENDHVIIYVEEGAMQTCITLDNERQMYRLGECLKDLYRTEVSPSALERPVKTTRRYEQEFLFGLRPLAHNRRRFRAAFPRLYGLRLSRHQRPQGSMRRKV